MMQHKDARIDELEAKERQLRDALQDIYEWSFQYVIPKTIKMQVCEAISGSPAVCPSCCELNGIVAQLRDERDGYRKANAASDKDRTRLTDEVARLHKEAKELREQLALNGQCEMRQLMEPYRWACKYRRELTEKVAWLREEIKGYKDLAVRLAVVTEERDTARAGVPVDKFLQKKVDELRAECDDVTGQFVATAAKLHDAQEELARLQRRPRAIEAG